MRTVLTLLVISSLGLSACSGWRDSRVNPSNWFGGSRPANVPEATVENPNPLIPERTSIFQRDRSETYEGTLVAEIVDVVIERTSTGGIVRVTGRSARQGAYDVRLINETDGEPVTFSLKALQPTNQGVGNSTARTIRVGQYVSTQTLERTRTIQIVGAQNARTTSR